ncbi:hypothetical protein GM415_13610 [Pseudodesulfovibrio cashew]|uniref:EF-hand domain-containing protein n=1 Tax=Pseudodesulfovibrio cashew TaxID=2678688 RepID=A0A6I6JJ72_9BACT|nr:EF-hand domain-containing protein [Pseudodesulfovibrio cashew]QGY41120.1 hypothetical protein GM415_13610 [Pseudodesulfovibrio cashew]
MSISAVGSGISGSGFDLEQMAGSYRNRGPDTDEMASFIVEQDDADGDGLLSLEETPLDEERFNSIDEDGDGFISAEELSSDAASRMQEQNTMMGSLNMRMQGIDPAEMAASIVEKDDADGDGMLSLDETPLDEDLFNSIDADGDGFITADELSADMEEKASQGVSAPPAGAESQAAAAMGGGSASGTESSSESDEEYDAYDLNEDGVVTFDELLQAFRGGDNSLTSMFQSMGDLGSESLRRYAMEAYQAQMG